MGFLSLKEPSQLALEQYADAQRKQAVGKAGPTVPMGTYITTQKLPDSVPKVNSKWDGVPESIRSSSKSTKSSRNSIRSSSSSSSGKRDSSSSHGPRVVPPYNDWEYNTSVFSVATHVTRGAPNSLASAASSSTDITLRRDSGSETPPGNSPSTTSLPEMTYFFQDDPTHTDAVPTTTPALKPSMPQHPWSPPPLPENHDMEYFTLPDPRADETEVPVSSVDSEADAIFRKLKEGGAFLAGEAQELRLEEDEDAEIVPDSHDFLFAAPLMAAEPHINMQPPVIPPRSTSNVNRKPSPNFSRPRQSPHFAAHKSVAIKPALPTLYEASIASTDADTIMDAYELKKEASEDSDTDSIASSIAPSVAPSFTPSEMSASWYRSSRERLGLGGQIRKNDVFPWDSRVDQPGKKKNRLSMFSRYST